MKNTLNLESISSLYGGAFGIAVESTLARVLRDCDERPGLDTAREVTIKIKVSPVLDLKQKGMSGVEIAASVGEPKIPAQTIPAQVVRTKSRHATDGSLLAVDVLMDQNPYQDGLALEVSEGAN